MATKFAALLSAALLCCIPAASHADTITFTASGNATGGDGPLSASALFTTGNGTVTVTLTNTLSAAIIRDAGQALSDISFTLSGTPGTIMPGSTASGQLGSVNGAGMVTYNTGAGSTDPNRWLGVGGGSFGISGNTVTQEAIGGGQPTEMIGPAETSGGTYANLNNGFQNFDPYVIGPATFVIDLSGVTASTTITGATFSFGTGPDTFLQGTPSDAPPPVPEPSSLLLLGTGMLGAAGAMRHWFASGSKRG